MRIEHVRVVDLTPEQLARCRELSFGDEGYMCEDLDAILSNEQGWRYRYSQAILLGETGGPQPGIKWDRLSIGTIYAWALLQPVFARPRYSAQFFVDPAHRRKGYGKMLLEQSNRWGKRPLVYVDNDNQGFFDKFPLMYERYHLDDKESLAS